LEGFLYLSLFIIIFALSFAIGYLLKVYIRIRKDIEIIKDELDITSAIFEVKFDDNKTNYKRRDSHLRNLREIDEKKQLSLDIFMNS